jgi:hypothetical protein
VSDPRAKTKIPQPKDAGLVGSKTGKLGMDVDALTVEEVATRLDCLISNMMKFWKNAHGWAPNEAAELMNKSMLEWQESLAGTLSYWTGDLTDGELILAWANIGALVEGQLKLALSVHYLDYIGNPAVAIKNKKGTILDPDGVTLEPLRVYFKQNIWSSDDEWDQWINHIQQRRNALHAFKAKPIGSAEEVHASMKTLLEFVRHMNGLLPYPDDIYIPSEVTKA